MENQKLSDSIEIIKMYSHFFASINNENFNNLKDELPIYFLQKNIISLYTLETLLEGISVDNDKVYDLNSISSICRNILETASVFNNLFCESKNKKETILKVNLWKLTYFNSSNNKFSAINIFNKYDVESLKEEILNNDLGIDVPDGFLNSQNTEYFEIIDNKLFRRSTTYLSERFLLKYHREDNPFPKFYRNYSEQAHTTFNTIQYFVVNPPSADVESVIINNIIHLYYIIDGMIKCFLEYHKISLSDEGLQINNSIVDKINLMQSTFR